VITNFGDRKECQQTGIITAFVDDDDHPCAVVRQGMVWMFMDESLRILTTEEQEYCSIENFKMENGDE